MRKHTAMVMPVVTLAAVVLTLVASPTPAGAIDDPVGFPAVTPVTWLAGNGDQLVVTSAAMVDGETLALRIARDGTQGQPLPATTVDVQAPALGLQFDNRLAAANDGTLTVVWRPSSCAADTACDRWYTTYDGASGSPVSTPVQVTAGLPVLRALDDGSLLTGAGDDLIAWRSPQGVSRPVPAVIADDVAGADVDPTGRLLLLDVTSTLTRTGPGGTDLTLAGRCPIGAFPGAIGAAPDSGFAVACGAALSADITVVRHEPDGAVRWETSGRTNAFSPIEVRPQRVTMTPDDTAWVGSRVRSRAGISTSTETLMVESFGVTSHPEPGYERRGTTAQLGSQVTDLRTIGDEAAFAGLNVCCRTDNATTAASSVHGEVLPWRPAPPSCTVTDTDLLGSAGLHELEVEIGSCVGGNANHRPTEYRIDVTWPEGATSVTVPDPINPVLVEVTGLPHATTLQVTVTAANELGESTAPPHRWWTVLPFTSLESFVGRQVIDLRGAQAPLSTIEEQLQNGSTTPAQLMEDLLRDGVEIDHVEPVARLYRAFFQRDPDVGGLRYWSNRHRAGLRLARIAEHFARSSEFQRTYGTLGDRAFAELVYRNVLEREGDPRGLDYWTWQLASRRRTRGDVMTQFSESSEHRRLVAPIVEPVTVTFLMLDRLPTSAERARWMAEPNPYATVPSEILGTDEYLDRITG